mmetsp:Transcript_36622/g.116563  ORF Transcript_36622/g.116563 Transcript_36622/m.116563 type:complete len:339 (+) Transcript_36622:557-1573(+)
MQFARQRLRRPTCCRSRPGSWRTRRGPGRGGPRRALRGRPRSRAGRWAKEDIRVRGVGPAGCTPPRNRSIPRCRTPLSARHARWGRWRLRPRQPRHRRPWPRQARRSGCRPACCSRLPARGQHSGARVLGRQRSRGKAVQCSARCRPCGSRKMPTWRAASSPGRLRRSSARALRPPCARGRTRCCCARRRHCWASPATCRSPHAAASTASEHPASSGLAAAVAGGSRHHAPTVPGSHHSLTLTMPPLRHGASADCGRRLRGGRWLQGCPLGASVRGTRGPQPLEVADEGRPGCPSSRAFCWIHVGSWGSVNRSTAARGRFEAPQRNPFGAPWPPGQCE